MRIFKHYHKRIAVLCLAAVMLISLLPAAASAGTKPILYRGRITDRYANSYTVIYEEMDTNSKQLKREFKNYAVSITAVYPDWVEIVYGSGYAYIVRNRVDVYDPIDMVHTPYCGVEKYDFYAEITRPTPVMSMKDDHSDVLAFMTPGARVALIGFEDGYAKLVYKRQYGYINTNFLDEVLPVAKTVDQGTDTIPIAAFTSYATESENRNINLTMCGQWMAKDIVYPNMKWNFNDTVGPFTRARGYVEAGILADNEATTGMGGGSCQVSSTLFNAVLQLPGIRIDHRRAHGANGAKYLPYGMDAASASKNQNFIFTNCYDFPIRIETVVHDTCLTILIYKVSQ